MVEITRALNLKALIEQNSFFLFGPRGTGKSYWIRKSLPDSPVFDLLDDEVFDRLMRRPKWIEDSVNDWSKPIVIDEIQKLPKLLDEVHRLIESRHARFLLTGSSARKLKRSGANLLAGRAWEAHLYPLTWKELSSHSFELVRYLSVGGLPRVYLSKNPEEELRSYIRVYLNEEIKAEALVRSYERFVRFLETMALSNSHEINYQSIASDAGVPPRTLVGYLEVLEDTLIGHLVLPYQHTKKRKAVSRSKFYFFDLGVLHTLRGISHVSPGSSDFGPAFETFITNEIRAYLSYNRIRKRIQYWRTKTFEVDLILAHEFGKPTPENPLIAIEIKSSEQIKDSFFHGLRAFQEENLPTRSFLISQSKAEGNQNGVSCLHYKTFLSKLWNGELLIR